MRRKEKCNERQSRQRLFDDVFFREAWEFLMESPQWANKSPRAILAHLDRLTAFPTGFATYLVDRALILDLPFIVQDNCIDELYSYWEYWEREKEQRERERNFVPPTVEEVSAFCLANGYKINPAKFVWYYEKRGWRNSNGEVLTNWKANVFTWNYNKNRNGWD